MTFTNVARWPQTGCKDVRGEKHSKEVITKIRSYSQYLGDPCYLMYLPLRTPMDVAEGLCVFLRLAAHLKRQQCEPIRVNSNRIPDISPIKPTII